MIAVNKHPDAHTLAQCRTLEDGEHVALPWEAMTEAEFAAWCDAQIAAGWAPPAPQSTPPIPYRILKDTLVQRIKSAGSLSGLMGLYSQLTPEQQFEFTQSTWFSSDNPMIVQGVAALVLDASTILAPDPLAP